jgi:hypothetical protein
VNEIHDNRVNEIHEIMQLLRYTHSLTVLTTVRREEEAAEEHSSFLPNLLSEHTLSKK